MSELEVMENRAQRDVSSARLEATRAELRSAELDLGYTEIRAPTTGRVGRSQVDPGNLVGAGEKTLLTTIVRYDPIYAYFSLSERETLALADSTVEAVDRDERLRQLHSIPLEIGRANDSGYPFAGNVDYVDPAIDPKTGTLLVRGVFANPDPVRLLPGIFTRGRLPIGEQPGALLVSERAIGSDQSGKYVLVVDDQNVAEHRPVELGALVDGKRVILKGLEPGDRVITNGILRARPGAKVTPETEAEAASRKAAAQKPSAEEPSESASESPES